jgi:Metallo-peptidase family M12B Reprolysin-like
VFDNSVLHSECRQFTTFKGVIFVSKRLLFGFAGVVALAALLPPVASANHSWGNYHWARTANPFTLPLGDNMSASWDPLLARASSDWSRSNVLDTRVVPGQAKGKCRPTAGRVEVCNGNYGFNGWLGLAQIWLSGNHITQAATKMNDSYLSSGYSTTNKQHVICQEIGHTFGLDHQDESGADLNTCMDYSSALDNPSPNQHDYDQLATIYAHVDSTTTVGTIASLGAAGSTQASPVSVERSDRIASSTIVERYADGSKIVTHVLWAVGGRGR